MTLEFKRTEVEKWAFLILVHQLHFQVRHFFPQEILTLHSGIGPHRAFF